MVVCPDSGSPFEVVGGGTVVVDRGPLSRSEPDAIGRRGLRRHLRDFVLFGFTFLKGMAFSDSFRGGRDCAEANPDDDEECMRRALGVDGNA